MAMCCREVAERLKAEAEVQEREKMQLLVSSFTEDQLDRLTMKHILVTDHRITRNIWQF